MAYACTRSGTLGHERLTIRRFANEQAMHKWINARYDNLWRPYTGPLKAGIYAYVGGEWRNVKSIDRCLLAHV